MFGRTERRSLVLDAALGALSGLAASWAMEKAQPRIMAVGSEETRERERRAQGEMEPATHRAAAAAARLAGASLDDRQKEVGGEIVHYATGAVFGALFGALAGRLSVPVVAAGAAYGLLVWLVNDEVVTPAAGLARGPTHYPASTHAKALVSHLVYGTATDAGYRVLRRVMH